MVRKKRRVVAISRGAGCVPEFITKRAPIRLFDFHIIIPTHRCISQFNTLDTAYYVLVCVYSIPTEKQEVRRLRNEIKRSPTLKTVIRSLTMTNGPIEHILLELQWSGWLSHSALSNTIFKWFNHDS